MAEGKFRAVQNAPRDPSVPISIGFDTSELTRLQELFPNMAKAIRQAYTRSLSRTAKSGELFAARRYRASYPSVPLKVLRENYVWSRLIAKSDNLNEISAVLQVKGSGILLEYFKAKGTDKGVSWMSKDGRKEIKGGFYAFVFKKTNKGPHWFRRKQATRFPVEFLWGPSPATVFRKDEPQQEIKEHLRDRLLIEVNQQLGFYMEKAVKDALKQIAAG